MKKYIKSKYSAKILILSIIIVSICSCTPKTDRLSKITPVEITDEIEESAHDNNSVTNLDSNRVI